MRQIALALLILGSGMITMFGCEKGRYTEDRHYVGDPERVPAASEEHRRSSTSQDSK